jgi:hypothetical protein
MYCLHRRKRIEAELVSRKGQQNQPKLIPARDDFPQEKDKIFNEGLCQKNTCSQFMVPFYMLCCGYSLDAGDSAFIILVFFNQTPQFKTMRKGQDLQTNSHINQPENYILVTGHRFHRTFTLKMSKG